MLDALLTPQTIAVIGASRSPGKVGHEVVANLIAGGFRGVIVPVNPSAGEVLGLKCYPDLQVCGSRIDLSVIAVPTALVRQAVVSSIDAGAKAVVVITAGFKEVGPEGAALEKEIADFCKARRVAMLGPNCLGLINTHHRMNASFAKQMPQPGGISVISQSGALCTAILDWAAGRQLGLAKLISIGNKADLTETDFLKAFAEDPETKVIVGYLESIEAGDEFIKAAEAAAIEKAGRHLQGRRHPGRRQGRLVAHRQPGGRGHRLRRRVQALRRHPRRNVRGAVRLRDGLRHAAAAEGQPRGDHHQRRRAGHHGRRRGRAVRPDGSPPWPAARRRRWPASCPPPPASATRSTCSATPIPTATSWRSTPRRTIPPSTPSSSSSRRRP